MRKNDIRLGPVDQVKVPEPAEYEDPAVQLTLDDANAPRLIREARQRQDRFLRDRYEDREVRIADIGCGDGYHAEIFAPGSTLYHGYEISPQMAAIARERCAAFDNVRIVEGDVFDAEPGRESYDVVWCLYFSPGNLRGKLEFLSDYDDAYLDANPYFRGIVSRFFAALATGGSLFLTVYKDVPQAEEAQRSFYRRTGQIVLTDPGSRFVATDKGFWSVRFTRDSMTRHLVGSGVPAENVVFHDLNEIAWLVEARR